MGSERCPEERKKNPTGIVEDVAGLIPGVGTFQAAHRLVGKYGPNQRGVNRLVRGSRNPEDIEFLNDLAPLVSRGHIAFTPEGLEEFVRDGFVYHAYSNTPVFEDGYRMGTPIESMEALVYENPAKFERCVKAVQARGGANGYAVCTARGLRNPSKLRRNPALESDALYEDFHGAPPTETLAISESFHVHEHLGGLGDLVLIQVRLMGGTKAGALATLNAPDPNRADDEDIIRVAGNEARNQMYLVGGDQAINLKSLGYRDSFDVSHDGEEFEATDIKDHMVLGEIEKLTYQTEKKFDKFKTIDYFHELGEDTKVRPFLTYDTLSKHMGIAGGEYVIRDVGIVN